MPQLKKKNDNMYSAIETGADFNRPLAVLKDTLIIADATMVSTRIVPTGFKYIMGVRELEVYVNGIFMRSNQSVNGEIYGEYSEHTNFSVKFNDSTSTSEILVEGAQIRFRLTSANYKISNTSGGGGIDPSIITDLQNDVNFLQGQLTGLSNTIQQVGRDSFGGSYSFPGTPSGSTRTIGTINDGETSPDLTAYRVWKTSNSSSTSITTFSGVCEDQRIIIIEDNYTTFVHNAALLVLTDSVNIVAKAGEIYQFIFDGIVWRQYGGAISSGITKWKQTIGTFSSAPSSTSTLTMTTDMTSKISSGMALQYKIGGTYFYGICHSIASNLLTINGAPLSGSVTELWYDESLTKISEIIIPVEGYYETRTELVSNGSFNSATTGWTANASTLSSVAGGYVSNCLSVASSGSAAGRAYQDITTEIGELYFFTGYFKKGTSTSGKITIGTTSTPSSLYDSGNISDLTWTKYVKFFVATSTTTRITLQTNDATINLTSLFDEVYMTKCEKALISNYCGFYIPWAKQKSYCVKSSYISKIHDSGDIHGRVTTLINGYDLNTNIGGLVISSDAYKFSTIVDINTSNYDINYGEYIEVSVAPGTSGDAEDLSVILTFVCP